MAVNLVYATLPYTIVTGCAENIRAEFAALGDEPARFCPIVVGELAWDECCDGMFIQSITGWNVSQDARNPGQYTGDFNFCGPNYVGFTVQALILRCVASVTDTPPFWPTCDQMSADALQQQRDAARVRSGIVCCLTARLQAGTIAGWSINSQIPQGPQGGCAGSLLTYQVWLDNCDCPPDN